MLKRLETATLSDCETQTDSLKFCVQTLTVWGPKGFPVTPDTDLGGLEHPRSSRGFPDADTVFPI